MSDVANNIDEWAEQLPPEQAKPSAAPVAASGLEIDLADKRPLTPEEMAWLGDIAPGPICRAQQGHEGDPRSRSEWQFGISRDCADAGVPDQLHYRILRDRENFPALYGAIQFTADGAERTSRNPDEYAARQVKRAHDKAPDDWRDKPVRVEEQPAAGEAASATPEQGIGAVSVLPFLLAAVKDTPWLVRNILLRGAVSYFTGFGGSFKTQAALQLAVAVMLRLPFLDFPAPPRPLNVALLSGEEDIEELQRRLYVIFKSLGIEQEGVDSIPGKLFTFVRPHGNRLVESAGEDMPPKPTPFAAQLAMWCEQNQIDVLIIDPLVEVSRGVDENSAAMEQVHLVMRNIACVGKGRAVLAVHHHSKAGTSGDQNSARGSSTLAAGARVMWTFNGMVEAEAKAMQIGDQPLDRTRYIRMHPAKNNYGPRGEDRWLVSKVIDLPSGKDARVVLGMADFDEEQFDRSNVLHAEWLHPFLNKIEAGRPDGGRYTVAKRAADEFRADVLLSSVAGMTREYAGKTVKTLMAAGVIAEEDYRRDGKAKSGLVVKNRPLKEEQQGDIPF